MKTKSILSLFLLCSINLFGQFIVAGFHRSSDYFYDSSPDKIIYAPVVTFPSYNVDSFMIDINNDHILDLKIMAESDDGGGWHRYVNCTIKPMNNNQISISGFDSCFANCPPPSFLYQLPMARLYSTGDSINNDNTWIDSTAYLAYARRAADIPNGCGYSCNGAALTNFGYLGVKVFVPNDTLFGWIKIKDVADSTLTVEEYACNLYSTSIEQVQNSQTIFTYPNPFSTRSILQSNKVLKEATLSLYNSLGQQVRQINNIGGKTVAINRDNLPIGLYYFQLTQDNQTIATDKLVIIDN